MIKTFEQFTVFAHLEKTMQSAADKLATIIFDEFIDWEFLKNATDYEVCDEDDISDILDITSYDYHHSHGHLLNELEETPFSIKDVCRKYTLNKNYHVIGDWVKDNWEDYLDTNTIDTFYEKLNIEGIMRDLIKMVEKNVYDKIKESIVG